MCMECNTLVEGLNTDRFNSGFPQAMEETENPNSSSTTAGDIDVHETNEELSEGNYPPPPPPPPSTPTPPPFPKKKKGLIYAFMDFMFSKYL